RDPVAMYQRWLTGRAGIAESEIERIDNEAAQRIDAAVEYTDALPFPKSETVTERLFAPSPHDPKPEDRAAKERTIARSPSPISETGARPYTRRQRRFFARLRYRCARSRFLRCPRGQSAISDTSQPDH